MRSVRSSAWTTVARRASYASEGILRGRKEILLVVGTAKVCLFSLGDRPLEGKEACNRWCAGTMISLNLRGDSVAFAAREMHAKIKVCWIVCHDNVYQPLKRNKKALTEWTSGGGFADQFTYIYI